MVTDTPTVLIVDDKEQNLQVAAGTLAVLGYEIMLATSGAEAFERLAARKPDLILLDILMPEMDGLQVCRELKGSPANKDIPVIFLSARSETNDVVLALESGGVDYITKPFKRAELLSRVRTHIELQRSRNRLKELVAQREDFIATLAHDLKNPLSALQLSGALLSERKAELPEKLQSLAESISNSSKAANSLLGSILDDVAAASTSEFHPPKANDLSASITTVVSQHLPLANEKEITLTHEIRDDIPPTLFAPQALDQILSNLISNAIKFSPQGGTVHLEAFVSTNGGHIIRVTDSGPGFTEADRERIFDKFVRLSARPTGGEKSTGLGLAIAKRLADQQGAELTLEPSEAGEGAIFVLALSPA